MKKNKLFYEFLLNLSITIFIGITSFLINKYFSIYLGAKKLGLMKLFTELLVYFNLAEMGLSSAASYALYKPLLKNDIPQISIIVNTITKLYNKIFYFVLVIGLFFTPFIPFFIKEKSQDNTIYLYWSLYVINTSLSYIHIKYNILFIADQKFLISRTIQGSSRIISQLFQIIVIIKLKSFFIFILLLICDNLFQILVYKRYYKKNYNYIKKTTQTDKSITENLKKLFYHQIAGPIVFNSDLILISKFISLDMVGIYASYQMIAQIIITGTNIILSVLRPKIGNFIAQNSKENIFNYWKKLNILFLFISLILSLCSYILIEDFIKLWLGTKFLLPKTTIKLLLINLFIRCFRGITDTFKDANGYFSDVHLPILEGLINFIFSIILVQYIGLNGVIIGTIVSNMLIIMIARPILVFKVCFGLSWKEYLKKYSIYIVFTGISIICVNLTIPFLNSEIILWKDWLRYAMLVTIVVILINSIVFYLNKDFRILLKQNYK